MRQRGEQVQISSRLRRLHFSKELALERFPGFFVPHWCSLLQQGFAGGKVRKPQVVNVFRCIVFLPHTAWRTPDRTDSQPFITLSGAAQPNDTYSHSICLPAAPNRVSCVASDMKRPQWRRAVAGRQDSGVRFPFRTLHARNTIRCVCGEVVNLLE